MFSTQTGTTMTAQKALSLLLLVVTACEGASLVLEASTLRISKDGEANFTLNCTTDEASRSGENSQIQKEIVDVQRMRIAKMKNNRWEPIVEMDSDWESPLIYPGVTGDHDLASGFIEVTWPIATNSTAGEYICDLIGYGGSGQVVSLRSPAVYVDVHFPMTLYDLFKMVKTSGKKFEMAYANITRIEKLFETASADITQNKDAIEMAFSNISRNKEAIEMASADVARNEEVIDMASSSISQNGESIKNVSTDVNQNEEAIRAALASITRNKETIKTAFGDIAQNEEAIESSAAGIARNEDKIMQTKASQEVLKRELQETSKTLQNNAVKLGQIFQKHNFITSFFESWPQGKYYLIEPNSGCPADTLTTRWEKQRYIVRTEPSDENKDKISGDAHFRVPVSTTEGSENYNVMIMYLCAVTDSPSAGRLWPPGSYCITAHYKDECPNGFERGRITYDDGVKKYKISYCCRNDSLPDTAILLPTRHPFYLFRFGGKCQHVWGMNAIEEYMLIDTYCCGSTYSDPVPDGKKTTSEITLQLCYYERETNNV